MIVNKLPLFLFLIVILCAGFLIHAASGPANLSLVELWTGLIDSSSSYGSILWKLRLPRVVYGMILGSGLAVCGVALQGLFHNPLAEPFTLGISSGAGFGAVFAIAIGVSSGIGVSAFALVGAGAVTSIVFLLVQRALFSQTALILCGVMVGYFFQSALMLIVSLSSSNRAHGAVMWMLGDLGSAPIEMLAATAALTALGATALMRQSYSLDLLSMGEEKAASLGVRITSLRRKIFFWSSLVTGTCVAAMGVVGFVGLIIPHVLRNVAGPKHAVLFPLCVLGGASFVLICDWAAKTVLSPIELPLGVVTGLIGSATFLWIFIRKGA